MAGQGGDVMTTGPTLSIQYTHQPKSTILTLSSYTGLLDLDFLGQAVQDIVDQAGADATEQACEQVCHSLILGGETALLHTFCPAICRS